MIYAVSAITAILLTISFHLYLHKTGYFSLEKDICTQITDTDTGEKKEINSENAPEGTIEEAQGKNKDEKPDEASLVYNKKQSFLFTGLFFILAIITNFFVYKYSYEMNEENQIVQPLIFPKMAITYMICGCAALTDYKRHKIPNQLILIGLISRAVIYIIELILAGEYFTDILKNDILGFAIGFIMLFVVAVITKGGIGFGDVKLFGVIGLMTGSGGTFAALFLSLLLSSICSIFLMIFRKKTLKSSVPMAPFIYLGYVAVIILGVF